MRQRRGNRFKDDIRRTFIVYAFIPIFIITAASYILGFNLWNKTIVHKTNTNHNVMRDKIETTLAALEEETTRLIEQDTFYKTLYDTKEKIKIYHQIYQFTNKLDEKVDFYIIDNNMEVLVASRMKALNFVPQNPDISWGITKRMKENPYRTIYECNKNVQGDTYRASLIIGKAIEEKGEVQGYILFEIDSKEFIRSVGLSEAQIVVTDAYDTIWIETTPLYSTQFGKIKQAFHLQNGYIKADKEKYYIKSEKLKDSNLMIYSISSISAATHIFLYVGGLLIIILTMLTGAIFIAANKIVAQKTKMIDSIVEVFQEVERGNLGMSLDTSQYEEFRVIGKAYNLMIKSINNLMDKNEEIARQTVVAEIKQLESQFNPHFLFNTLEHIKYMAKLQPDAASKMIVSLSHILRYSINANIRYVTIEEDLNYTTSYLRIQKYRFSNRFNYMIDIPEEAKMCIVPKLILQPIIENAIKYGFGQKDTLEVRLKILLREEQVVVVIYDDGIGMSKEKLQQVKRILEGLEQGNHMGLYNVHRRITLMYGEDYGLEVRSEDGHGTVVKMTLPIKMERGEEND